MSFPAWEYRQTGWNETTRHVHRDLKPSNVLVTLHDGVPVPKVIDFGIAKATQQELTEKTIHTQFHQFVGTPAYVSPEQAEMSGLDIDTRSDIYSLGVLLYELLTGTTPFDAQELIASGLEVMRRTIREKEPPRPSQRLSTLQMEVATEVARRRREAWPTLLSLVHGDLDWIVMKCMEKDRGRRYETANGLAADLRRHLSHEPVAARPPSRVYRLQKAMHRNKLAFAAGAAIGVSLLMGIAATSWMAWRATRAEASQRLLRAAAEEQRATAEANERMARDEAAKNRQAASFIQSILTGLDLAAIQGQDRTLLFEILMRALRRAETELNDQPEVQVEVVSSISHCLGREDEGHWTSRLYLARALNDLGRGAEAAPLLREAALGYKRTVHVTSLRATSAALAYCQSLVHLGRLDEAEVFAREWLRPLREVRMYHPPALELSLLLARVLTTTGQQAEAGGLLRESFDMARRTYGPRSPLTREIMQELDRWCRNEGLLEEEDDLERLLHEKPPKAPTRGPAGFLASVVTFETKLRMVGLHGVIFGAWLLLFAVQTTFIARGRVRMHRRLGIAGVLLAAMMVVTGYHTSIAMARRGYDLSGDLNAAADPLGLLVFQLGDLVSFSILVGLGVAFRKRTDIHKRLMVWINPPPCCGWQPAHLRWAMCMRVSGVILVLLWGGAVLLAQAERINHAGRLLGPAPVVTNAVLFNTPEADALVAAMLVFPVDSAWNEDISGRPVLANSDAMIAQISSDLLSTRRTLRAFKEMNFVLVPDAQPLVPIEFTHYGDESDPSPYPIPANLPIETWPSETGGLSLEDWQRDINGNGGDRHSIIVQPGTGSLWETWLTRLDDSQWQAANGARFDLLSNALRPAGWTSGDAAGLPMFPALVRYDECERGEIEHALRIVVKRTRADYLYPARHYASVPYTTDPNVPAMGQRLRLKSSFVIPASWTRQEKAVLNALKRYGALVADNGNFFSISVTPDDRWPDECFDHLTTVGITNFEVIQVTGPSEGPRSPDPPTVDAGTDRIVPPGQPAMLEGSVSAIGLPTTNRWTLYSGPGGAVFGDATRTNTTVAFDTPGVYTLMLSASDGVHAVACDAVVFTVATVISLTIARDGADAELNWTGGAPPYVVERTATLNPLDWQPVLTNAANSATIPALSSGFFRVRGQTP